MFKFIKQTFIALLSFNGSLATKCISFNNKWCLAITTLIEINGNKLLYYPFTVSLDRCN